MAKPCLEVVKMVSGENVDENNIVASL